MDLVKVEFKKDTIEVINDFISVRKVCENIGLVNLTKQYERIKADESYQSKFIDIEINNISQKVFCIPLDKLNGWLFSINPNKVKPEVRQKLIEYKNECFEVLHKHFNPSVTPSQSNNITNTVLLHDIIRQEQDDKKYLQEAIMQQNALLSNSIHARDVEILLKDMNKRLTQQITNIFMSDVKLIGDALDTNTNMIVKELTTKRKLTS